MTPPGVVSLSQNLEVLQIWIFVSVTQFNLVLKLSYILVEDMLLPMQGKIHLHLD